MGDFTFMIFMLFITFMVVFVGEGIFFMTVFFTRMGDFWDLAGEDDADEVEAPPLPPFVFVWETFETFRSDFGEGV